MLDLSNWNCRQKNDLLDGQFLVPFHTQTCSYSIEIPIHFDSVPERQNCCSSLFCQRIVLSSFFLYFFFFYLIAICLLFFRISLSVRSHPCTMMKNYGMRIRHFSDNSTMFMLQRMKKRSWWLCQLMFRNVSVKDNEYPSWCQHILVELPLFYQTDRVVFSYRCHKWWKVTNYDIVRK